MKKSMSSKERAAQIELLQARAALERQSMARSVKAVTGSLTPRGIIRSFFPRASSRSATDWIMQAVSLTRRYPLIASSASTLLSGIGKRRRWWRIGAGLLLSWHVARTMNNKG